MNPEKRTLFVNGFVKEAVDECDGILKPFLFDWDKSKGFTLMNPSIYNDKGQLISCVRVVNYTLHHSEKGTYPHWSGPLQYVHPENDVRLATENYLVELDDDLNVTKSRYVLMTKNLEPKWEFHGLEDARVIRWGDKLYLTGVRRDTTDNGQGRMELTEIELQDSYAVEVSRVRIPSTGDDNSYCEKNWMPVIDQDFKYIKWTSPTEIVDVTLTHDEVSVASKIKESNRYPSKRDIRGGSQLVPYKDYYIAFGHSVALWKPYAGEKDSDYVAHIMVWDRDFNLIKVTDGFKFLNSAIEFCCGLCLSNDEKMIVSFSYTDNVAYMCKFDPDWLLNKLGL